MREWCACMRRSCVTDRQPPPVATTTADVCLGRCDRRREWEKGSQTVSIAEAGLFESLPRSLYSLLVDTHSVVRTPVMGKS